MKFGVDGATTPIFITDKVALSELGGICVRMTNGNTTDSVKGTLVRASATSDLTFITISSDANHPIGAVYEAGVTSGDLAWVVTGGIAQVLIKDGTAATAGYWVHVSSTDSGRVDITLSSPPGGAVASLEVHMQECGHCLETVASGSTQLAKILMHFN